MRPSLVFALGACVVLAACSDSARTPSAAPQGDASVAASAGRVYHLNSRQLSQSEIAAHVVGSRAQEQRAVLDSIEALFPNNAETRGHVERLLQDTVAIWAGHTNPEVMRLVGRYYEIKNLDRFASLRQRGFIPAGTK